MKRRVFSTILISFLLIFLFSFPIKIQSAPTNIKILPILMDFTDQPHQRTASEMYDYFFSNKEGERSLRNYYLEVTNGTVDFVPGSYGVGDWILMDYGDVIIHIFREEERQYYQLEKLWRNARLVYSKELQINKINDLD